MIKNIIFDVGNVLMKFEPQRYTETFGIDRSEQELLYRELFRSVEWVELDRGTISLDEAQKSVCARLPKNLHKYVDILIHSWYEHIDYLYDAEPVAEALKKNGYKLYVLSNFGEYFYIVKDKIPAMKYMDGMVISADCHLLKPEKEIYLKLLNDYSLNAEECYFIDDSPSNVASAIRCGMKGCVHHNFNIPHLKECLKADGIKI